MSKIRACLLMCVPSVSHSPFNAERLPSCLSVFTFGSGLGAGTQPFKNTSPPSVSTAAFKMCPKNKDEILLDVSATH